MFYATMSAAIGGATTLAQMDALSKEIWRALSSGAIGDDDAQALAELLHVRRGAIREAVVPIGIPLGRVTVFPRRIYQRSPDRSASIERRRRLACSGPMPPALASRFTTGQLAVLRIVGDEVAKNGVCGLCIDAIAARAGVCRRLAQGAIRLAEGDGLLLVTERRHQGRKNDTNLIRVLNREWRQWLERGRRIRERDEARARVEAATGCKAFHLTDSGDQTRAVETIRIVEKGCRGAAGWDMSRPILESSEWEGRQRAPACQRRQR